MRYVIVGGVAAGVTAATRLRRLDETADIVLLERGEKISFANCALPYYAGGIVRFERLYAADAATISEQYAVDIRERHETLSIDRERKTLAVRNLATNETYELSYDKLIPAVLQAPLSQLSQICHLTPGIPVHPMLAKPTKGVSEVLDRLQGRQFTCEFKYDGERAQVRDFRG